MYAHDSCTKILRLYVLYRLRILLMHPSGLYIIYQISLYPVIFLESKIRSYFRRKQIITSNSETDLAAEHLLMHTEIVSAFSELFKSNSECLL
jgi:hypothetical protein